MKSVGSCLVIRKTLSHRVHMGVAKFRFESALVSLS